MPVSGDCAACHGPHTRGKRPGFDLGRPTPVRDGLSAGGRGIRTLGPAKSSAKVIDPRPRDLQALKPGLRNEIERHVRAGDLAGLPDGPDPWR